MTTGKIEYSPDYKSKSPSLPKDFGLMKVVCADGKHRFLLDAPKCGCGTTVNPDVELVRLEREIIDKAKAYIDYQAIETLVALRDAVRALKSFEAEQKK